MEDLSGKKFGMLAVIRRDISVSGKNRWNVICDCGKSKVCTRKSLVSGNTKSCGCNKYSGLSLGTHEAKLKNRARPFKDLTGERFQKLTVLSLYKRDLDKRNRSYWLVRCDCGEEFYIRQDSLKYSSGSCGCDLILKNKSRALPDNMSSKNSYFAKTKKGAEKRGLSFNLTLDQLLKISSLPCEYCGSPPNLKEKLNVSSFFYRNGVDRLDNNVGYELDNCVPCCTICNRAKSSIPYSDWLLYLENLVKFRISK